MGRRDDCNKCDRLQKRINHLEKQLSKYKKQVVRTRQRLSELEYLAKESEIILAKESLEELQVEVDELPEEFDKPPEFDVLDEVPEDEYEEITRFDIPTGRTVTERIKKFNPRERSFTVKQEKLSYSRMKKT